MTPLRHHRLVKQARRRALLVRRTGRWRPDHITLAASGHVIHVDPADARGWEIVRGLGRGHQPALIDLWRRSIDILGPTVVVDVGANYGEIVLSGRYPAGARVLAVEANPAVAAKLARSIEAHPDHLELHPVLASDTDGGTATLRVDPAWSGSASVALQGDGLVDVEVPVRRIDRLFDDLPAEHRLLLKIDAEGWEEPVLRGLTGLTGRAASLVAIVEFDPAHLRRAGSEPVVVFDLLRALGRCGAVAHDGTITAAVQAPEEATDLLVVSDPAIAHRLGVPGT